LFCAAGISSTIAIHVLIFGFFSAVSNPFLFRPPGTWECSCCYEIYNRPSWLSRASLFSTSGDTATLLALPQDSVTFSRCAKPCTISVFAFCLSRRRCLRDDHVAFTAYRHNFIGPAEHGQHTSADHFSPGPFPVF